MLQRRITVQLLLAGAAALLGSPAASSDTTDPSLVESAVSHARTKDELSGFIGAEPHVCVQTRPGMDICEWRAGNQLAGWRPIAAAIQTRDRIALLCEVPSDAGPRPKNSCFAYPQRSNRSKYSTSKKTKGQRKSRANEKQKTELKQQAHQAVVNARNLVELSTLVGAVPNECWPTTETDRMCLWRTTSRTYGHGTLAASIGASLRKRVRLRCALPNDGSPRTADACIVEIGG